ncbi:MAG: DMT family transporter [Alphaproteobacteria bacterium]|nr:DMT family transporter [Alphaproteobacteria bacterium]
MDDVRLLWIPVTISAAVCQCARTALQKQLAERLGNFGATYVRYLYGAPLAVVFLFVYLSHKGISFPELSGDLVAWSIAAGISQIAGTWCLLKTFSSRNFAIGTLFGKTETVQVAILGTIVLGEALSFASWSAIVISTLGVALIASRWVSPQIVGAVTSEWRSWTQPLLTGLASGLLFAVCAISVRAATLLLPSGDFLLSALIVLAVMTVIQLMLMTVYTMLLDRPLLTLIAAMWRISTPVGILSVSGSLMWFVAIALETPSRVYTLGQIEVIFTLLVSRLYFRERLSRAALAGCALITLGVLLLVSSR